VQGAATPAAPQRKQACLTLLLLSCLKRCYNAASLLRQVLHEARRRASTGIFRQHLLRKHRKPEYESTK
jgi:hypothetical protein